MIILKHVLYFACGWLSVLIGILLLGMISFPETLFWARLVALLPLIIPCVIAVLVWRRSPAFAAAVIIWIVLILIGLFVN